HPQIPEYSPTLQNSREVPLAPGDSHLPYEDENAPKFPKFPKELWKEPVGIPEEEGEGEGYTGPPLKKILFWNDAYGNKHYGFGYGREPFIRAGCRINTCTTTAVRAKYPLKKLDAVIWHFRSNDKSLPAERSPHTRYIFWMMESASYLFGDINRYNNVFNWTFTYRLDSDIPNPYGRVYRLREPHPLSDYNYAENKTKLVAWFVSNCKTQSGRENVVRELKKWIQVDIYGRCGPLKCPKSAECTQMLNTTYKFYLSFENSLCQDYATEKLTFFKNCQCIWRVFHVVLLHVHPIHRLLHLTFVFLHILLHILLRYLLHLSPIHHLAFIFSSSTSSFISSSTFSSTSSTFPLSTTSPSYFPPPPPHRVNISRPLLSNILLLRLHFLPAHHLTSSTFSASIFPLSTFLMSIHHLYSHSPLTPPPSSHLQYLLLLLHFPLIATTFLPPPAPPPPLPPAPPPTTSSTSCISPNITFLHLQHLLLHSPPTSSSTSLPNTPTFLPPPPPPPPPLFLLLHLLHFPLTSPSSHLHLLLLLHFPPYTPTFPPPPPPPPLPLLTPPPSSPPPPTTSTTSTSPSPPSPQAKRHPSGLWSRELQHPSPPTLLHRCSVLPECQKAGRIFALPRRE
ncbi:hypothetical protein C7M84_023748, partial [Penaeus vannamei]